ncbi:energy transducer TonB [uncultured Brevundimonas sp.]|uniref:energy transducer TonB family protein n=1 Tax=uncultured Brevundimonas sp. TaxID=213418 RepID=UPI0030EE1A70
MVAGVGLAHAGLFALLALAHVPARLLEPAVPIMVELVRPPEPPPPPPPPPPPEPPAPVAGGGAPAAPSRVHVPPKPAPVPREVPAPRVQAPEPALVVGVSDKASPTPDMGQGGEGTGTGSGRGAGDGPGSGGTGPQFLRGPSQRDILSVVPPEARRARQAGRSTISCLMRADTRLEGCRIVSETPEGFNFGQAALRASVFFRFRPPTSADGRVVEGQRVTVNVQFGRQGR